MRGKGQGVVGRGEGDPRGEKERRSGSETGKGVEGKAGKRGREDRGAQRLSCEVQTGGGQE